MELKQQNTAAGAMGHSGNTEGSPSQSGPMKRFQNMVVILEPNLER